MIVRCPSCKTTYKVDDDLVKDANPAFRCSRCKHTFELESTEAKQAGDPAYPAQKRLARTRDEQELSFTFAPKKQETEQNHQDLTHSPRGDFQFPSTSAKDASKRPGESIRGDPLPGSETAPAISADKRLDSTVGIPSQLSPSQPLPLAREPADNVLPLDPYRDQPASAVPFLTLFALLAMLFGFATAFHQVHPEASEKILRSIPLVGPAVLKNNHLKSGVALQSLRANHLTIQGNREVLVVTGVVQNQNPVVIRELRVAGQLYNLEGKTIEQQTIWIGNAISPRIIRNMTVQDISDLQRLKPLKNFEIPPGDSIPFTIVFLRPTKETKDFSCEVLTAEAEA